MKLFYFALLITIAYFAIKFYIDLKAIKEKYSDIIRKKGYIFLTLCCTNYIAPFGAV